MRLYVQYMMLDLIFKPAHYLLTNKSEVSRIQIAVFLWHSPVIFVVKSSNNCKVDPRFLFYRFIRILELKTVQNHDNKIRRRNMAMMLTMLWKEVQT
jgi:hypothetical protein